MSKSGGPPERAEARRSIARSPSIPDRCRSPQVVVTCGGFGSVERRGTTGGFRSRLDLCQLRLVHLQADGPPTERRTLGGLGSLSALTLSWSSWAVLLPSGHLSQRYTPASPRVDRTQRPQRRGDRETGPCGACRGPVLPLVRTWGAALAS